MRSHKFPILFATLLLLATSTCIRQPTEPGPILRLTRCKIYYARTNTAIHDLCATCQENPGVTEFTVKGTVGSVHYYMKVYDLSCVLDEPVRYKVRWLPTGDIYVYPPEEVGE